MLFFIFLCLEMLENDDNGTLLAFILLVALFVCVFGCFFINLFIKVHIDVNAFAELCPGSH